MFTLSICKLQKSLIGRKNLDIVKKLIVRKSEISDFLNLIAIMNLSRITVFKIVTALNFDEIALKN